MKGGRRNEGKTMEAEILVRKGETAEEVQGDAMQGLWGNGMTITFPYGGVRTVVTVDRSQVGLDLYFPANRTGDHVVVEIASLKDANAFLDYVREKVREVGGG